MVFADVSLARAIPLLQDETRSKSNNAAAERADAANKEARGAGRIDFDWPSRTPRWVRGSPRVKTAPAHGPATRRLEGLAPTPRGPFASSNMPPSSKPAKHPARAPRSATSGHAISGGGQESRLPVVWLNAGRRACARRAPRIANKHEPTTVPYREHRVDCVFVGTPIAIGATLARTDGRTRAAGRPGSPTVGEAAVIHGTVQR
jgi:hypothetical protein